MPIVNNMTFQFAGAAGTGCDSQGAAFARSLTRAGLWVHALFDFESKIRGGHIFYQIRVADSPIDAQSRGAHAVLAFDEEAVSERIGDLLPGGAMIFDDRYGLDDSLFSGRDVLPIRAPLTKIATDVGGNKVMMNTAAVGVLIGLIEMEPELIEAALRQSFTRRYPGEKGQQIGEANVAVLRAGMEFGHKTDQIVGFQYELHPRSGGGDRVLVNGNYAIAMGAIAGGCRFISGYPMTPATTILEFMAAHQTDYGVVVKQTEDELAGILSAIGAAHVGARAMTATSGGGFCLMVEALGLAGATETPLVVVDAMRVGPSTGMPTRTEQGDLEFAIHASHGEFPRIVLAPGSVEECFETGHRAFNLADRYQTPVIVLTDLYQAFALKTLPRSAFGFDVEIDRGQLITAEVLDRAAPGSLYARHKDTPSGVSPRALPGHPNAVFMTSGDEHSERGFITESATVRREQMEKRMRKQEHAKLDMRLPERHGPADADVTLIGWGSTKGAIAEAVDRLNQNGPLANSLHFTDVWPLRDEVREVLEAARYRVCVEQNFSGQFASVIQKSLGVHMHRRLCKYDGRQITPDEIVEAVAEEVKARV